MGRGRFSVAGEDDHQLIFVYGFIVVFDQPSFIGKYLDQIWKIYFWLPYTDLSIVPSWLWPSSVT